MSRVDEAQFFRILCGVSLHGFIHRGTGELRLMDGPHEGKSHDDRLLLVPMQEGKLPVWAGSVADWSFYVTTGATARHYMVHKQTGETKWADQQKDEDNRSFVFGHVQGIRRWLSEVFISKIPRGSACVRWSLRDLIEEAMGSNRDGRWLAHNVKRFETAIGKFWPNFEAHCRPSHRAVRSRALHGQEAAPSLAELLDFDSEYTVSTEGFVVTAAYLRHSRLKCDQDVEAEIDGILALVLDKVVGQSTRIFNLDTGSNGCIDIAIRDQQLVVEPGSNNYARRTLQAVLGGNPVPLHLALTKLFDALCLKKWSRYKWLTHLFKELVSSIASQVELLRDNADMWEQYTHADLPVQYRSGSARPRAVSDGCKIRILNLIADEPDITDPRQMFGAKRIMASSLDLRRASGKIKTGKRRFGGCLKKDACRGMQYTEASQYNAAGFKAQNGSLFANLGFDGSAKGGTSWTVFACWNNEKQLGWWLPLQAWCKRYFLSIALELHFVTDMCCVIEYWLRDREASHPWANWTKAIWTCVSRSWAY